MEPRYNEPRCNEDSVIYSSSQASNKQHHALVSGYYYTYVCYVTIYIRPWHLINVILLWQTIRNVVEWWWGIIESQGFFFLLPMCCHENFSSKCRARISFILDKKKKNHSWQCKNIFLDYWALMKFFTQFSFAWIISLYWKNCWLAAQWDTKYTLWVYEPPTAAYQMIQDGAGIRMIQSPYHATHVQ